MFLGLIPYLRTLRNAAWGGCGGTAPTLAQTPMPLVRRDGTRPCADLGCGCMGHELSKEQREAYEQTEF